MSDTVSRCLAVWLSLASYVSDTVCVLSGISLFLAVCLPLPRCPLLSIVSRCAVWHLTPSIFLSGAVTLAIFLSRHLSFSVPACRCLSLSIPLSLSVCCCRFAVCLLLSVYLCFFSVAVFLSPSSFFCFPSLLCLCLAVYMSLSHSMWLLLSISC